MIVQTVIMLENKYMGQKKFNVISHTILPSRWNAIYQSFETCITNWILSCQVQNMTI